MSHSFNCPCPLPPIRQINDAVELFNQNETYLKQDAALHELFFPAPGGRRLALCAFALDALWNAGISGFNNRDWPDVYDGFLHRIAHLQRLAEEIRSHPLPVPDAELDLKVISPSVRLLENLLDLVQRNYYVFAAKFMHWWVGTPPIDGRTAAAIRKLCNRLETKVAVNPDQQLDRFTNLIRVYNCWLNQLGPDGIHDLQQHDYAKQSQWPDLRCWNTPVRILDKFLWITDGP